MNQYSTEPEYILEEPVEMLDTAKPHKCINLDSAMALENLQQSQKACRLLEDLSGSIANRLQELVLLLSEQVYQEAVAK